MDHWNTKHWEDRFIAKALTNRIIDTYFDQSESWLRAILRMCIFSMTHLEGQPTLLLECPNPAVAKRLSRKTYPLLCFVEDFIPSVQGVPRVLLCYSDGISSWQCYDSKTRSWVPWTDLDPFIARKDD